MKKVQDVDAYIADAESDARPILEALRTIIKSTIPGVEEGIWYGVPFYAYHGEFVGFDAFKKHVSFGFGADVLQIEERRMIEEQGYKLGKGTMQIKFTQAMPIDVIQMILKAKSIKNETNPTMSINLQ